MRAGEYGDSSNLPALASNLSAVLADLTTVKDCMASPASTACTGGAGSESLTLTRFSSDTYGASANLPALLTGGKYASWLVFMLADNLREM